MPGVCRLAIPIVVAIGCGRTDRSEVIAIEPAGGASFSIPDHVGPVVAAVGGSAGANLQVTNTGTQSLAISAQLDAVNPNSAEWQIGRCAAPQTCTLDAGGTVDIPTTLHPNRHGTFDTTISITGLPAVGTQSATLIGTGLGGQLRVDRPPAPFVHDFGTIAKNQLVTFAVAMTDTGNQDITVTPSDPGTPFAVDTTPVAIVGNHGTGTFDVTCMSAVALAQTTSTIDLALSPNTYDHNTDELTVVCEIANATIQVTNPLDFGELRIGEPEGMLDVTIDNPPGGGDVMITQISLAGAPPAVTLVAPTLPATLADGNQLVAQLELATTEDVTLDNVVLEVEVAEGATETLRVPVSGRVGTPVAVVLPSELDLGTVCLGALVAGEATLTNTGTATLVAQQPTIDSPSFAPVFTNPGEYPVGGVPLPPTDKAVVGVMPTSATAGKLDGVLSWPVDVPGEAFEVPISLEILAEGTAVSPARLAFGTAAITDPPAPQQTITLENCGPDTASLAYSGPVASRGTADAWQIDPPAQQRTLLPGERTRIRVAFAPTEPGRHEATLPIDIDGVDRVVRLEGDATGTLPERTTFYACGCSGPGAPARGWPIVIALLVIRRRR